MTHQQALSSFTHNLSFGCSPLSTRGEGAGVRFNSIAITYFATTIFCSLLLGLDNGETIIV
jgi:hypothetical protein